MTLDQILLLVVIAFAMAAFVREWLPIDLVALCSLALLLLFGLVTPIEAISGFANEAVVTVMMIFVLSEGVLKSGLLTKLAHRLTAMSGDTHRRGSFVVQILAGALSGFINNVAALNVFMPVSIQLANHYRVSPSKVLLPLSYATIFGGTCTLIGTSTNLLISSLGPEYGFRPFSMFEMGSIGVILFLIGVVYSSLIMMPRLPDRGTTDSQLARYLEGYLSELEVKPTTKILGQTLVQARVAERFRVTVLEIERGSGPITEVADVPLELGDRLILQGTLEDIVSFRSQCDLRLLHAPGSMVVTAHSEGAEADPGHPAHIIGREEEGSPHEDDTGGPHVLMEVLIPPISPLVGQSLRELDFRRAYRAQVVALRRTGDVIRTRLGAVTLAGWDTLVLYGDRLAIDALVAKERLTNLHEHDLHLEVRPDWWINLGILVSVVALASLGVLPILTASIYGVVAMLVTRRLTTQEAYQAINWSVIFLVAAILPMGTAMVNTGLASLIGDYVAGYATGSSVFVLLSILYLTTTILTEIMSNNSTAVLMVPISLSVAQNLNLEPFPLIITVAFGASASFLTPMGYKTNAMVYGPGGYRFMDYIRFGAPLKIVFWLISVALIPQFWPLVSP